jgi:hypothetical protein
MTELEARATYGLLSKTILDTLANKDVDTEAIFMFLLHMQWGIIMGHPEEEKTSIATEMLQRITEKILKEKRHAQTEFQVIFIDNRESFLTVYKQVSAHSGKPGLAWYVTWKEHCNRLLAAEPASENCFQLFMILKECMNVKQEEFLLSITVIHETLQYIYYFA